MVMSQKHGVSERSKCFPIISRGKMPKLFELSNYLFLRSQLFQLTFKLNKLNPLLIQFQILRCGENQRFLWKTSYSSINRSRSRCHLPFLSTYSHLIYHNPTRIQLNSPQIRTISTTTNICNPEMSDITGNE